MVNLSEKLLLSINEASEYSGIGVTKVRELIKTSCRNFVIFNGNKQLIKRKEFEEWIEQQTEI